MKVLIVENESYLANSIATKLNDIGYSCEVSLLGNDICEDTKFDVVLLSTGIIGLNFNDIIKKHKNSTIILMINSINNDIISAMKMGADDYILKPIIMEEIIRKIKIFDNYKRFETLNKNYEDLISLLTKSYKFPKIDFKKIKLPIVLVCSSVDFANSFMFAYAKNNKSPYDHIDATTQGAINLIKEAKPQTILFISNFELLEPNIQEKITNTTKSKNTIFFVKNDIQTNMQKIFLKREFNELPRGEIISIDDYTKFIISEFQNIISDTELSKKLGISRKSLWEKRKRYGITKK